MPWSSEGLSAAGRASRRPCSRRAPARSPRAQPARLLQIARCASSERRRFSDIAGGGIAISSFGLFRLWALRARPPGTIAWEESHPGKGQSPATFPGHWPLPAAAPGGRLDHRSALLSDRGIFWLKRSPAAELLAMLCKIRDTANLGRTTIIRSPLPPKFSSLACGGRAGRHWGGSSCPCSM